MPLSTRTPNSRNHLTSFPTKQRSTRTLAVFALATLSFLVIFILLYKQQKLRREGDDVSRKSSTNKNKNHHIKVNDEDDLLHHDHQHQHANNDDNDELQHHNADDEVGAEIGHSLYDRRMKQISETCEKAFPPDLIRNALNTGGGRSRHQSVNGGNSNPVFTKKKKVLYFIGDSHALRSFRWMTMFVKIANFLKPASVLYVDETVVHNMDRGVFHDQPKIEVKLIPNPARLMSIEFRRAVFVEDVAEVLKQITASTRKERNFEAIIYLSAGSWDFLRPTFDRHGFTIDSLFPNVNSRQDSQHQIGNEHLITLEEATEVFHKRVGSKWKENCEKLDTSIINAFGWGNDVEEDHHLRRQMSNGGIVSRVSWRWPGAPNCTASRFQQPRASLALEAACNFISDNWWDEFFSIAKQNVRPGDRKPSQQHHSNDEILKAKFDFFVERKNWEECTSKVDGVHPTQLCVAKEMGSYLLRVLSL